MTKKKDELFDVLEKGIRDILAKPDVTTEQQIQAIAAGSRLLQIKHKVKDSDDTPKNFFNKG